MALVYVPLTELEAVNVLLASIGEQPVNAIPASGVRDAVLAQSELHKTSRFIQGKGLHCNTEYHYSLVPDAKTGYIAVPSNCLSIDEFYPNEYDIVQRGLKLYDKYNHTYVFTTTIKADLTFFLPFTDLPSHVREYITVRAARTFQQKTIGSSELDGFTALDEQEAKIEFERHELRHNDFSILYSSGCFDVVNRRA